ncbi:MAG: hypothetical protein Q9M94_07305, partial [Candidatus Gracilibacteria bacterium]|nr:hypothetical protein [Candidatus Gracilibacteria bacterium]
TSFMYQGSFNHSACKNSSFSIGFLLYFNILYTKIKFYLIDLRKSPKSFDFFFEKTIMVLDLKVKMLI